MQLSPTHLKNIPQGLSNGFHAVPRGFRWFPFVIPINFNVDYRPGSKKSKFDMTLIRHSPFNVAKHNAKKSLKEQKIIFINLYISVRSRINICDSLYFVFFIY